MDLPETAWPRMQTARLAQNSESSVANDDTQLLDDDTLLRRNVLANIVDMIASLSP